MDLERKSSSSYLEINELSTEMQRTVKQKVCLFSEIATNILNKNTYKALLLLGTVTPCEASTLIIPILHMKKVKHREVTMRGNFPCGHTARNDRARI